MACCQSLLLQGMNERFVMDYLKRITGVWIRKMDGDANVLLMSCGCEEEKDPVAADKELFQRILEAVKESQPFGTYSEDENISYGVFKNKGCYFIFGPVAMSPVSPQKVVFYLSSHHVKNERLMIPYMHSAGGFTDILAFAYGLISGEQSKKSQMAELADQRERARDNLEEEKLKRKFENREEKAIRYNYQLEREYIEYLEDGRYDEFFQKGFLSEFDIEGIGRNAKTVPKQNEYLTVTSIGLAVRAAIRAGVDDIKAYDIGDIALCKLSMAKNPLEMNQIGIEGTAALNREIQKVKERRKYKSYAEQCRYYIEQHIFEKIRMQDIAEEIGVTPNYLSKQFSEETNMRISEYILREKIRVSCKFLKYTKDSVAVIAAKMNMASQSYYTMIFKRYTGISPVVYRNADKSIQREADNRILTKIIE